VRGKKAEILRRLQNDRQVISLSKFFGTGSKDPLFKIFLIVKKTKKKEILRYRSEWHE
jgi:hypothetical protein